jgi:glucose/arabinose dehydrogenase/azurin/lysophospholipase L1-like esterase
MYRSYLPVLTTCIAALVSPVFAQQPNQLALKAGDHISIVGNALPDRMQHDGWLETLIQAKYPNLNLVFRNLAVAGDEVNTWHRSQDFGSRDQWLTWMQTDVIFAFYGFNESFKGYEGIEDFKATVDKFLKDTSKQNYSGKGAPRVVLFSPIANEKHQDPNFADPTATNTNLKNYTDAMAEVAKANGVEFVDLYTPSLELYTAAAKKGLSLTANGMHLTEAGDAALAPIIFKQLFGEPAPAKDLSKLRAAVNEKNREWHQRYRTVDGYNVYGGRSREKYAPKGADGKTVGDPIFNNAVMQREMQQRDVITANRDKRVWAVANGSDLKLDDSDLPASLPVATNKPGDKPDLSWTYPDAEAAIAKMKVAKGCKINLFADEKQFPDLVNPVQMAWDTKGRLWVAAWRTYPERAPQDKVGDKLIVLEDTNGDGKADKCTTFIDNLNSPTGFTFYKDGVLLMQAPDLWYVRDTNGDGKADTKERVVMGMDSADSHHTTNSMNLDPGGATYLSDGVFHRTQVETANGPVRHQDAIIWRFEPRSGRFEKYAPYNLVNPHGKVWDYWGNDLLTNATGNNTFFGPAISGHLDNGDHPGMKQFWDRPARPCPGTGILSSGHFPDDWQENFLNLNVISFQGIYRVKVTQDGSGLKGERLEDLVSADPADLPTFRPSAVSVGPDGAIYFCDWAQTIIGHLQHHLRDPNRDHSHGRVYRITYEGRPLLKPAKIDGQPTEALLNLLKAHENDTRTLAKVELGKQDSTKVIAALNKWVAALDPKDPNYQHHLTEALWVHQWHNIVDVELLKTMLRSPEPQARAAATRVLCYWRDRVPNALELLKVQAADEDPRVRLHAVRAASFFEGKDAPAAAQIAFETLKQPGDYYLDYVYNETMRQLRTKVKEPLLPTDPIVLDSYVSKLSDKDLANAPESEPVLLARLERKSSDIGTRTAALEKLAALHKADRVNEIVSTLKRLDASGGPGSVADELAKMLTASPAGDLSKAKAEFTALVTAAKQKSTRRAAAAAWITAEGNPVALWASVTQPTVRETLLSGIGAVVDPTLRAKFQPVLAVVLTDAKSAPEVRSAALTALPLMGPENAKANYLLLANALKAGSDRIVAAHAIRQLPRDSWDAASAGPVVDSIVTWAKAVPAAQRSNSDVVSVIQLGQDLAGLLPAADAARYRKELRGLSVSVFVVRAVHEQMRYDTPRLVVEAGKPFEVIFENPDTMPHNFVIIKPGTREKVGMAAATMKPDDLDKKGRAFIPKTSDILDATKLVEPETKETLKFTAPQEEGDYEYVCTFPGHFMVMWGKLAVVKDVDAYLQANPVAAQPTAGAAAGHLHQQ